MKESGAEWIGEIPEHWSCARTRLVARLESGHTPSRNHPEYWVNCNKPWFTLADVWQLRDGSQKYVYDTKELVSELGLANSSARLLPKDTVILSRTASVGFSAIMGVPMATTQDFVNWVCGPRIIPTFLLWVFRGMKQEFERLMMGSTHKTIYMPDAEQFSTPLPPLPEQRAIAEFLDRKTAQIDAVVAKKRRLIERLQEKRQALISHAVTKGLDPHAPMKESGIEWLKEVPAHWMIRRFRHCGTIPNGQVDPRLPAYRDMVLIAPNHIESETGRLLLTETAFEQGAESGKYVAQEGDVIYSKIRPELQKACIAPENCLCSADMYPITPKPDMVAEYILYNLLCDWFTKYAVLWSDRVAMPKVNRETVGNCFMVVPPLDEQKRIVRYIMTQTEHIDRMTDRIRTQIAKLQEYRQTLISAAVTGKIHVTKEAAC
jgi:type I restriction enzyme S subunit